MSLRVFLGATLRKYFSDYDAQNGIVKAVRPGTTVENLLRILNIPTSDVKIVMVNGRAVDHSYRLTGDERIGLFPPLGGG